MARSRKTSILRHRAVQALLLLSLSQSTCCQEIKNVRAPKRARIGQPSTITWEGGMDNMPFDVFGTVPIVNIPVPIAQGVDGRNFTYVPPGITPLTSGYAIGVSQSSDTANIVWSNRFEVIDRAVNADSSSSSAATSQSSSTSTLPQSSFSPPPVAPPLMSTSAAASSAAAPPPSPPPPPPPPPPPQAPSVVQPRPSIVQPSQGLAPGTPSPALSTSPLLVPAIASTSATPPAPRLSPTMSTSTDQATSSTMTSEASSTNPQPTAAATSDAQSPVATPLAPASTAVPAADASASPSTSPMMEQMEQTKLSTFAKAGIGLGVFGSLCVVGGIGFLVGRCLHRRRNRGYDTARYRAQQYDPRYMSRESFYSEKNGPMMDDWSPISELRSRSNSRRYRDEIEIGESDPRFELPNRAITRSGRYAGSVRRMDSQGRLRRVDTSASRRTNRTMRRMPTSKSARSIYSDTSSVYSVYSWRDKPLPPVRGAAELPGSSPTANRASYV